MSTDLSILNVKHLYLHVPFCAKVCPYCCFYVHGGGVQKHERFTQALVKELQSFVYPPDLETIFIGGGTPSMLSARLFEEISKTLPRLSSQGEWTLEVNPATVTESKARTWKSSGVNRVSLGVQSFRDEELKQLGRQHTAEQAVETFQELRGFGFQNINVDLIFGLPEQTIDQWIESLEIAVKLDSEHLSIYQLTYEEDTPFFEKLKSGLWKPNEEFRRKMFEVTQSFLSDYGFERYEVSNYSKPGFESRHNQAYWTGKDYKGFGPSAVSTIQGKRFTHIHDTERYVQGIMERGRSDFEVEELSTETLWRERLMLGLRTREGVIHKHFEQNPQSLRILENLKKEGLIERVQNHWRATREGWLVVDSIAGEFF